MSGFRNVVFPLVVIRSGAPNTGLFVYNGNPAKGKLIAQIVAPGVIQDPFGNAVSAVLNIGIWSAAGVLLQHFGIDQNGIVNIAGPDGVTRVMINNGTGGTGPDIRFFNDFGAVILVVDPSRGGTFQYQDNNSAVQGVLIGAQVGKNTTDPINGTAVGAGITIIDPAFGDTLTAVGANISWGQVAFTAAAMDVANVGSTNQGPFRSIAAPEQTQTGHVVQRWYGTSPDGTRAAGTVISLTDPPSRATPELVEIQGTAALANATAPASLSGYAKPFAASSQLRVIDGADGNNYATQRQSLHITADQTINSTSPAIIGANSTSLSFPMAANRSYRFRAVIYWTQGATQAQQAFRLIGTGGLALGNMRVSVIQTQQSTAGATVFGDVLATLNADNAVVGASGFGAGANITTIFDGVITPAVAGTLNLEARCVTSSADTYTIRSWSFAEIMPE